MFAHFIRVQSFRLVGVFIFYSLALSRRLIWFVCLFADSIYGSAGSVVVASIFAGKKDDFLCCFCKQHL